ncbi:hypothetical protein GCM10011495_20900 [Hymenobacter frigidus]|uniref:Uncharacterized protein n=1 Tax=Hymenobacter frigidus TaxID=1524095 RepID=A0ABQ2A6S6_9BACT|nr:hypothetical protein GCM10011495_20900 [Hymenobacter frigidus]
MAREGEERKDEEQDAVHRVFGQHHAQCTQQGHKTEKEKERGHEGVMLSAAKHLITLALLNGNMFRQRQR